MPNLPLTTVPIVDYGLDESAMVRYRTEGKQRALALGNRGPIRLDANGKPGSEFLEVYSRCGFYIFEGVLGIDELDDIEKDVAGMLARAPIAKGAEVDSQGRPALGVGCEARNIGWIEPLSDPVGGTDLVHGRHPGKMIEL